MSDGIRWALSVAVFFLVFFAVGFVIMFALLAFSPNLGPLELGLIAVAGVVVGLPVARFTYRKLSR